MTKASRVSPAVSSPSEKVVYATVSKSDDMDISNRSEWSTEPDCADSLCYTTFNSADDYNMIARHVGAPPTDRCSIYCMRKWAHCGGLCALSSMAEEIKLKYELKHNLKHQDTPHWVFCCPEITWRQIRRDYYNRFGTHKMPAAPHSLQMTGR